MRLLQTALLIWLPWLGYESAFAAISDLLIALESDGRSHTAQHTIASNGPTLTLMLPGSVIPQEVRFMGPDQARDREQYDQTPGRLVLSSGSAFARYPHQYGDAVQQLGPGEFVLTIQSTPHNLRVENGTLDESSITWVFPSEFEVTSYTLTDPDIGSWIAENNTLTFHHIGAQPVTLGIEYRYKHAKSETSTDLCADGNQPIDACAPDNDNDEVPDYRDICLLSDNQAVDRLGCADSSTVVLSGITFISGRSYLNVNARRVLDRVAFALQIIPHVYFEVAAHTDNQGAASHNQTLSKKRANAVRHYLLLRGVNPNQIRALGYGEAYPIQDNATSTGQRMNRRIELSRIE